MFDHDTLCDDFDIRDSEMLEEVETRTIVDELPQLADHLRSKGAVLVRLEYKGSEGEGMFLPLRCFGAGYKEITIVLPTPFLTELQGFCATLLNDRHPGWEQDHGACGDFGWDMGYNSFAHVHRPYAGGSIRHDGV